MSLEIVHDIETLATTAPNAIILTVGAVLVDTNDGSIKDSFYKRAIKEQPYRVSDQETVDWWQKQSREAQEEAFGKERHPLPDVLIDYNEWIKRYSNTGIWGNGSDFDNLILNNAFTQYNLKWPYWNNRCLRNQRGLVGGEKLPWPEGLTKHIAIDDATYEAAELTALLHRQKNSLRREGAEMMHAALLQYIDRQKDGLVSLKRELPEAGEHCRIHLDHYRVIHEALENINPHDVIGGQS